MSLSATTVKRRFIDVGGRAVHCRITGHGPPALFVHSSPANSSFVINEMAVVADRYTCFAFDTPGFGQSDPLPGKVLTVAELADAVAETLAAIGMPPCPVFGTHTGAAIALELASRHPDRVTGLILDGLASFTKAEFDALNTNYFLPFAADPLGGHFTSTWTRFRDQSTWFPWFARDWRAVNESDLSSAAATNIWVAMFFDAVDNYAPAYRAALAYRDGPRQVAALQVPAVLTAIESDMLYPHLDRVPAEGAQHMIRRVGNDVAARRALTGEAFARYGSPGEAPRLDWQPKSSSHIVRQFIDIAEGQLLLRTIGDRANPPLLILHDCPGAGARTAARMRALAATHFVLAFDLPGCGESTPVADTSIAGFAAAVLAGCDAIAIAAPAVWGVGFGASLAVAIANAAAAPTLVIEGMLAADPAARAVLAASYAPPIAITADGSHWYRTWLMLRDSLTWWPWFTPTKAALRRVDADFEADFGGRALHDWTREVLRQPDTYAGPIHAALRHDAVAALANFTGKLIVVSDSVTPLATAFHDQIAALPGAKLTPLSRLAALL